MMRLIWHTVAALAVIHLLLVVGLLAYLWGTGRLDRQRIGEAMALVSQTAEQRAAEAAAEAEKRAKEEEKTRSQGPSVAERMAKGRWDEERQSLRLERLRDELKKLEETRQRAERNLERQRQALEAQRQAFERRIRLVNAESGDEGFKKAVELYETLPAKQVKQQFLQMLDQDPQQENLDQIVGYLKAMQPRKAAAVLREFEGDAEIAWAVKLMERLRGEAAGPVAGPEISG